MSNLKMYCITVQDNHLDLIQNLNYIPVGLGNNINSELFTRDNIGKNISQKNPFYGEYTFHYWLWKNKPEIFEDNKWIGFCQYRKFWTQKHITQDLKDINDLKNVIIDSIPTEYNEYEAILGEPLFVNQFRFSKFIKNNFSTMIKNPSLFFDKRKRNLKFHFDMMHGHGNLEKAINLLEPEDKQDFKFFVENSVSFNPHNMFICKSNKKLEKYYNSLFSWLEKCENEFGFNLEGYGMRRIYGFLAERYMSFWFQKNTKFKTIPILFKDISDYQ